MRAIFITFLIGLTGGGMFTLLHIPLSWMLGSMVLTFVFQKWSRIDLQWPPLLRDVGLVIVGYAIGQSFSMKTLVEIGTQLPSMLTMTVAVIIISAILAYLTSKVTGINLQSTITGSIPGGLSQMVVLGEEMRNIDLTVVTILQVVRLLSVIFVVPFLVFSPLLAGTAPVSSVAGPGDPSFVHWSFILFLGISAASAFAAKKIHLPTAPMLGPIMVVGGLVIAGVEVPFMPDLLIILAQLCLGIYFSFMLDFSSSKGLSKFIPLSIVTSLCLLISCIGLSFILSKWHDISFLTAFISLAPGGMAEMAIVGQSVNADLSIITGYHLFRILFILFIIPFVLRWLFKSSFFLEKDH
ncbi:AbrB family transcriptional regulator [Bacillus sp. Marseille-Q1617]|uniref:AbrB family transcriptional regulator n=1 Tax=Bacillus sp. Marseille-Q1617 TaxID=2736887 RepID=UPI00158B2506|nr:AbrB family transcriptional regulator [Bacillus sp. Marseille-Q1617]